MHWSCRRSRICIINPLVVKTMRIKYKPLKWKLVVFEFAFYSHINRNLSKDKLCISAPPTFKIESYRYCLMMPIRTNKNNEDIFLLKANTKCKISSWVVRVASNAVALHLLVTSVESNDVKLLISCPTLSKLFACSLLTSPEPKALGKLIA